MFEKARYTTRRVANEVGQDLQACLWELIEERRKNGRAMDSLQTFELSRECALGEVLQKIVHWQEEPTLEKVCYDKGILKPLNCRVWVIDSGDYATMLFPEEY